VRHLAIGEQRAVESAYALVHRDGHAPVAGAGEPARLDARVDLLELPAPVVAHVVAAGDPAALEGVGPVDVGCSVAITASTSRALKAA
jgi:hypothetical protein